MCFSVWRDLKMSACMECFSVWHDHKIPTFSITCLSRASLGATCVFRIDSCSVYKGYFDKNFLRLIFMLNSVYTAFWLRQEFLHMEWVFFSVVRDLKCLSLWNVVQYATITTCLPVWNLFPLGIVVNIFKSLIKCFTSFRVIIIICSY